MEASSLRSKEYTVQYYYSYWAFPLLYMKNVKQNGQPWPVAVACTVQFMFKRVIQDQVKSSVKAEAKHRSQALCVQHLNTHMSTYLRTQEFI